MKKKSIIGLIPNFFTLSNLACGVLGILFLFDNQLETAGYLIWIAVVFDFLDGFLARTLKATSEIGKQLDSLADLVTFGVLPSIVYFKLLEGLPFPWAYFSILVVLLSALRLAKFNIDESQTEEFKGLTTTANGLLCSVWPFIIGGEGILSPLFENDWTLWVIMLAFSIMMVAPLTLFSLKFKNFHFKENWERYLLLAIGLILLLTLHVSAIPLILLVYFVLSIAKSVLQKAR